MNAKILGGTVLAGIIGTSIVTRAMIAQGNTKDAATVAAISYPVISMASIGTVLALRDNMQSKYGKGWRSETDVPGSFAARHPILSVILPIFAGWGGVRSE